MKPITTAKPDPLAIINEASSRISGEPVFNSLSKQLTAKIEKGEAGLDIAIAEKIALLFGFGLDFIYRGDLDDVPLGYRASILSLMHAHRTTL